MRKVFSLLLLAALATSVAGPPLDAQSRKKDDRDRRVAVVNASSSDMMRLYASRTRTSDWEENILSERGPIPAGSSILVNFDDGTGACHFDFRVVLRDHRMAHMWNINVCVESEWHVVD